MYARHGGSARNARPCLSDSPGATNIPILEIKLNLQGNRRVQEPLHQTELLEYLEIRGVWTRIDFISSYRMASREVESSVCPL